MAWIEKDSHAEVGHSKRQDEAVGFGVESLLCGDQVDDETVASHCYNAHEHTENRIPWL